MSNLATASSTSRKRRRDETEEGGIIDERPFTIRHSSNTLAPPRAFHPICLLPRAQLPLAYLDTATHGSALFTGRVPVLETRHEHGENDVTVCIARDTQGARLHAVERVKLGCYALCRLRESITESALVKIGQLPLHKPLERPQKKIQRDGRVPEWWTNAAVDAFVPTVSATNFAPSNPSLELMRKPSQASKLTKHLEQHSDVAVQRPTLPPLPDDVAAEEKSAEPQEVLEQLAKQYLDTLYLSRTSLAYFIKGPLSKARVALSTSERDSLTTFLRESILMPSVMDKKYRESIPGIAKSLFSAECNSPDKAIGKGRKRRQKFKRKRSKAGFFSNEQDFVERWWEKEDEKEDVPVSTEDIDATIRRRLTRIRNRETFMQIILVLEVLSLEAALQSTLSESATTKALPHDSICTGDEPGIGVRTPKAKKAQHLPTQLEAMLDKLCIWYSLESHSPARKRDDPQQSHQSETSDELKSFCVEVIIPFFSARIPEYATMVCKKFGGPSAPSPAKRRSLPAGKSGVGGSGKAPAKTARNSLARVSTEIMRQRSSAELHRPPLLQRAATDSESYPFIKLEGREVSLNSIPPAKAAIGRNRSTSIAPQLQQFTKREVDLTAVAATNEAKIRKKKDVENKLKEAVEMLKKPNRALAVKENAPRVDERFVSATTRPKPKSGPSYHSQRQEKEQRPDVHVHSTPSHTRTIKATPHRYSESAQMKKLGSSERGSTHVPSSSTNYRLGQGLMPWNTPSHSRTIRREYPSSAIQDTPSRGFAKFMPPGLARLPGTLESPIASRISGAANSSSKNSVVIQHTPCKSGMYQAFQPLVEKPSNTLMMQEDCPKVPGLDGSVYDALGWDDDGYEELR